MEVAASSLGFAQIGVSAGKVIIDAIKLWGQVESLPTELQVRINRLGYLREVIVQIENEIKRYPSLRACPATEGCLDHIKKAEVALSRHVEKFSAKIEQSKSEFRRRVKSLKFITFQKEEMETLEKELASAMELMDMSISLFRVARSEFSEVFIIDQTSARVSEGIMASQNDAIQKTAQATVNLMRTEMQHFMATKSAESTQSSDLVPAKQRTTNGNWPSCFETVFFGKYSFRRSKTNNRWTASFEIPWSRRVSEVCWTGWQYRFHTYNIRPNAAPAFKAAEKGDVAALISLFQTGQATPFDRNEKGRSLLYLAAKCASLEVCRVLISNGVTADDERDEHGHNPIDAIVVSRQNFTGVQNSAHMELVNLFHSAASASDTLTTERLFNFIREFSQGDDFLRVYQSQFLRNYPHLPVHDRAEAVRLGSFIVRDNMTCRRLLHPTNEAITPADVRDSVSGGFSLVQSAAISLGKRLADDSQYDAGTFRARSYTASCSDFVSDVVRVAGANDLNGVETIVPWDCFQVPVWKGTPLISLIGGALCRLSSNVPPPKWDHVFQAVLRQWLQDLKAADVDLLEYGRREAMVQKFLCPEVKGAFDSNAIIASRSVIRNQLQESSKESWMRGSDTDKTRNDRYWAAIRIVSLDYGPKLEDWRLRWVVDSEAFAGEFWRAVEAPASTMPGSWVD